MTINIQNSSINEQLEGSYEPAMNTFDSPFAATRHNFLSYFIGHQKFTYDEWIALPDDDKSAALFLNFYDQITLAWYKSKSFYAEEEEAVETVLQYLEKNIPLIEKTKSKYSEPYIYKVAYNCLYCISHDRKVDKDRWAMEISNIQSTSDDDTVDLFDTCASSFLEDQLFRDAKNAKMWKMIEDIDIDAMDIALKLINNESLGRSKEAKRRAAEIIEKLKVVLAEFVED